MEVKCSEIIISSQSYVNIVSESLIYDPKETGGIFLGRIIDTTWYILEIIDPGYTNVQRSRAYFEYDQRYVTHVANVKNRIYKSDLQLLGLWHRHPGSMDTFSSVDDETNLKFSKSNPNGSISALINFDPSFRMTFYHVNNPLKYSKISTIKIGDEYIDPELKTMKSKEDFNINLKHSYSQNISWTQSISGLFRKKKKEIPMNQIEEKLLEILDFELDSYLEKQYEYSYKIKIENNVLYIDLNLEINDVSLPKTLQISFFIDNSEVKSKIGEKFYSYQKGFLKKYIEGILRKHEELNGENSKILRFGSILGLDKEVLLKGINEEMLNKFYKSKLKDFHPDLWETETDIKIRQAAEERTKKITEAYEFLKSKLK